MNLQMRLPKCALKSPLNNYGSHTIKDELDWTSKTWISKICVRNPMNCPVLFYRFLNIHHLLSKAENFNCWLKENIFICNLKYLPLKLLKTNNNNRPFTHYAPVSKHRALTICKKKTGNSRENLMERFIPVEIFRKKSNTFGAITFFPFLPKRPKFSVPFV